MAPEIGPKSFGTFEKQTTGQENKGKEEGGGGGVWKDFIATRARFAIYAVMKHSKSQ